MVSKAPPARIQVLPPLLIDKIAAGEVIEGPFSVIKELLENALDAGASSIRIDTHAAGTEQITVEDNGHGIHSEDLKASLVRHATSKIASLEDLERICSLGFRGEALAAIASISHLQIKSRCPSENTGNQILCRGSRIIHEGPTEHSEGTTVKVSSLFYSTPARRKYLKSARTENSRNYKEIVRLALANPQIHFAYYREAKEFTAYPAGQGLRERILAVYGEHLDKHLLEIEAEHNGSRFFGYISSPEYFRANRDGQFSFVNKRAVDIKHFSFTVRKAYDELLSPGMQPYYFLFLEIDPARIDVNVHPQKREVRLLDQSLLQNLVLHTLTQALRPHRALGLEQVEHRKGSLSSPKHKDTAKLPLLHTELQHSPAYILGLGNPDQDVQDKDTQTSDPETGEPSLSDNTDLSVSKGERGESSSRGDPKESLMETLGEDSDPSSDAQFRYLQSKYETKAAKLVNSTIPSGLSLERHFGTILGTYILAEGDGSLYIIDQHTAHERVNYEKNLAKMKKIGTQRQELLEPILIHCLADELENIISHKEKFLAHGFCIEAATSKSYAIREVPPYLDPGSEMEVLVHLVHRIMEGADSLHLYKDYAAMRACKASIKKNDAISNELLAEILKDLPQCEEPSRCPHGRPTMIQISRQQLDRMFQR